MKTKSAIRGARAAADTKEAATTAANTRSPKRAKPRIGRAAHVGWQAQIFTLGEL